MAYRKHIADRYMTEAVPAMKDHINHLMNLKHNSENYQQFLRSEAKERAQNHLQSSTADDVLGVLV